MPPTKLMLRLVFIPLALCLVLSLPCFAHHVQKASTKTLVVTTSSVKARDLYERAMADYENFYLERANIGWRAAAQADPDFAVAFAWIAFNSRDPEEVQAAREKAKSLASKVTPGERLMIQWISNVQENNLLAGISAMNDMLTMYPKDKRLFYLAGNWLMGEHSYAQAETLFRRALAIDPKYPAALNDLAYAYARNAQFAEAFEAMDRYVALLPTQPNPQDSYGELLRMSGNFSGGLERYRAALKIDPSFITSQLGLGDTYALMGDQENARAEYDKVMKNAETPADRLDYGLQKAATWTREGNFGEADKAFEEVAYNGHSLGIHLEEAQAHRIMSLYQTDDSVALQHLAKAEEALHHPGNISQYDRESERARILRYRIVRASHAGNRELAEASLQELQLMTASSRNSSILDSYHGASGALLMASQKYEEAISDLQEDPDNPYSLELLSQAYAQTGALDKVHEVEVRLRSMNLPTMEQALVVPTARSRPPR